MRKLLVVLSSVLFLHCVSYSASAQAVCGAGTYCAGYSTQQPATFTCAVDGTPSISKVVTWKDVNSYQTTGRICHYDCTRTYFLKLSGSTMSTCNCIDPKNNPCNGKTFIEKWSGDRSYSGQIDCAAVFDKNGGCAGLKNAPTLQRAISASATCCM